MHRRRTTVTTAARCWRADAALRRVCMKSLLFHPFERNYFEACGLSFLAVCASFRASFFWSVLSLQPDSVALRWSSQKGDNDSLRGSKRSKNLSLLPINSRIDSRGLEGCVALVSLIGLSFGRTSDVLCLERILMGTLNSIRCAEMEDCDLPCHWPN